MRIALTSGLPHERVAKDLGIGEGIEQSGGPGIIADLTCGYEEADRAAVRIGHGMKFRIHATLGAPGQASGFPPFTAKLDAVRCALR